MTTFRQLILLCGMTATVAVSGCAPLIDTDPQGKPVVPANKVELQQGRVTYSKDDAVVEPDQLFVNQYDSATA